MLKTLIHLAIATLVTFTAPLLAQDEQTLVLVKPNAVAAHHSGDIIKHFETQKLTVKALKMTNLSNTEASRFYAIHSERPFYHELVRYMSEGPIVAIVLEGENAVQHTRTLVGATDPKQAVAGSLRALFGESITRNSLHSSDSTANAREEIAFFFAAKEITPSAKKPTVSEKDSKPAQ